MIHLLRPKIEPPRLTIILRNDNLLLKTHLRKFHQFLDIVMYESTSWLGYKDLILERRDQVDLLVCLLIIYD